MSLNWTYTKGWPKSYGRGQSSRKERMAAFDRLPRKMRDCLNYSLLNMSSIDSEILVNSHGADRIIHDIGVAESRLSLASIENL